MRNHLVLSSSLSLVVAALHCFQPCALVPPAPSSRPRVSTRVFGGYYADPEVSVDRSQTHMVFGERYQEVTTSLPDGTSVKGLRPLSIDSTESSVEHDGQRLVDGLAEIGELEGRTVIEIGSSTFSLAAAAMGASSVMVYHPNAANLRKIEYAHQYLGNPSASKPNILSTHELRGGEALPSVRAENFILVFTMSETDRLDEAINSAPTGSRIMVPRELVPSSKLDDFDENFDATEGIFIIRL